MTEVFFEIHSNNMREGPGNSECTQKAFALLRDLPTKPRILDVGCGPGAQTIDLSRLTDGTITAMDNHAPFVQSLNNKIMEEALGNRVQAVVGDMCDLRFEENSFDLIWSEGAIYIIGFEKGFRKWKPLLKKGGYLAVSELTWIKSDPPTQVAKFWKEGYPAMQNIEGNLRIIEKAGYRTTGHFILPESAWWDTYYGPIEKKLPSMRKKYRDQPEPLSVIEAEQMEMDLFRRYSEYYNYVFYITQKL